MKLLRVIAAVWLVSALSSSALTVAGVELPTQRDELTLQGAGLLRKGIFFKIYVGALYLASADDAPRVLTAVPKRLDIHYFHKTPKKHMVEVAEETLRQNLSAEEYAAMQPHIDALHDAYRDGKPGGCASLIYRPAAGLTYAVDGETIMTIQDEPFANAYFAVWLGEHPSSPTMKEALLRQAEATP